MRKLLHIKRLPVLMTATILAIVAFQLYWLNKAYEREERTLEMRTNYLFRETVFALQGAKLKLDKLGDSLPARVFIKGDLRRVEQGANRSDKVINLANMLSRRIKDTDRRTVIITSDSLKMMPGGRNRRNRLMQFLFDVDSAQDSLRVKEIESAYAKKLDEQNIALPFSVSRVPTVEREQPVFNEVTLGFARPVTYQLTLGNTFPLLLKRIATPILFSLFLVALTFFSFMLLYRNLLRQQRLSAIKNEFISNITHELKTPIATVSVAIEALRSFNASIDPQRTREYLDISANELQRLSLLVDKVLKLSMFEKKEIDLRNEPLDMQELVNEVTASMRLQFEKKGAEVSVTAQGDTQLQGDRLHLVSVIFNLLDNALKYSREGARIGIAVNGRPEAVELVIQDDGIGIPPEYHRRIFEKFFRVPTGNLHNAKGYGLGLSYVAHIIDKHRGNIRVESDVDKGSSFYVTLPKSA